MVLCYMMKLYFKIEKPGPDNVMLVNYLNYLGASRRFLGSEFEGDAVQWAVNWLKLLMLVRASVC